MPCDSITTQSVALAKAIPSILMEALKTQGWNITQSTNTQISAYQSGASLTWTAGKGVSIRGTGYAQKQITSLTKTYSKEAVTWAA